MKIKDITVIPFFIALMAIGAYFSIPTPYGVSFTMQTFAVFLSLLLLGGGKGSLAILLYLFSGLVGAPVFSGFRGGFSCFLEAGGGFLLGFLLIGLVFWLFEVVSENRLRRPWIGLLAGLLPAYASGVIFFVRLYMANGSYISLGGALLLCVVPYVVPDLIKLYLAVYLYKRLKKTSFYRKFNAESGKDKT